MPNHKFSINLELNEEGSSDFVAEISLSEDTVMKLKNLKHRELLYFKRTIKTSILYAIRELDIKRIDNLNE